MIVRVSGCGAVSWRSGQVVWDDHLHHRQLALTDLSLEIVHWFADWRPLEGVRTLSDGHRRVGGLGHRHAPISLRRPDGARLTLRDHGRRLPHAARAGARRGPSCDRLRPRRTARRPARSRGGRPGLAPPGHGGGALRARSARQFTDEPVALEDLAAVVHLAAGTFGVFDQLGTGPEAYKTSPAAGALHPTELYLRARRVTGLAPGTYHYVASSGALELIRAAGADVDSPEAYGGQPWPADSPVTLIHTAVVARNQWRYRVPRGYRDVVLGLGHVSQTVLLLATARGLGATFVTALRDDVLEQHLGCDGIHEVVLGVHALGHPAPQNTPAAVRPDWLS